MAATLGPIPLGLGTFEAACVGMLSLLGVAIETALAATLLLRGLTFWLPMVPGLWLAKRRSLRDDHLATPVGLKRRLLRTRRARPHRALVERSRADEATAITPQDLVEQVVLRGAILHGADSSRKWVSEAAEVSSAAEQPHDQNDDQDNPE